jgi:hypothetical protein
LKTRTTAAGKRSNSAPANRTGETIFLLGGQSGHEQQNEDQLRRAGITPISDSSHFIGDLFCA